jgi:arsenate reductase
MENTLFQRIEDTIRSLDAHAISDERKRSLKPLVDYIQSKKRVDQAIRLNFICTHNSRRSHLAQVWAQAMAHQFGVHRVNCYSGGTETTALFPMAAKTLAKQGFDVRALTSDANPIYSIKFADNAHPVMGFSKTYDDAFNPASDFAAVMTCSQADAGCPFIPGAEARIPITYEDPKLFDDSPRQAEKYAERSLEIATEMLYVFLSVGR